MRASAILGVVLSIVMAGSAMADAVQTGVSRKDVKDILAGLGMTSDDQSTDDLPLIVAKNKGLVFNTFLYECGPSPVEETQKCGQIQFRVVYENTKKISATTVNKYQIQKVFGRAYISEDGSLVIFEYPMHLEGGVTKKNLIANLKYYLRAEADFEAIVQP